MKMKSYNGEEREFENSKDMLRWMLEERQKYAKSMPKPTEEERRQGMVDALNAYNKEAQQSEEGVWTGLMWDEESPEDFAQRLSGYNQSIVETGQDEWGNVWAKNAEGVKIYQNGHMVKAHRTQYAHKALITAWGRTDWVVLAKTFAAKKEAVESMEKLKAHANYHEWKIVKRDIIDGVKGMWEDVE